LKTILSIILVLIFLSSASFAQELNFNSDDDSKGFSINKTQKKFSDNLFYGGEIGVSIGSYSQITIAPSIGYKFNNMLSTIIKINYTRAWESNLKDISGSTIGYNQFGGSAALRFSPVRQAYAMLEPAYYSYETPILKYNPNNSYFEKERTAVPFIFLGAGFYQPIANTRAGITGELKVDLLRDKNSPYKEWAPIYTVGVVYGF